MEFPKACIPSQIPRIQNSNHFVRKIKNIRTVQSSIVNVSIDNSMDAIMNKILDYTFSTSLPDIQLLSTLNYLFRASVSDVSIQSVP